MKTQLIISLKILGIMTFLLGIIYPLFITGVSQICFPEKANGSLIKKDGKIIGSSLIGQEFNDTKYFTSRPSTINYNPLPSGASNLGLTSKKLHQQITERKQIFITNNGLSSEQRIPFEMIFASGSGLDPHISPEAAYLQINRIAQARGFSSEQKNELKFIIDDMIEKSQFGLLGESRINVLMLNLKLDKINK